MNTSKIALVIPDNQQIQYAIGRDKEVASTETLFTSGNLIMIVIIIALVLGIRAIFRKYTKKFLNQR